MNLPLGFPFCSMDLYFCICASTILSWWLWLCSRAWCQAGCFLQFHSSFSRLLWLDRPLMAVMFLLFNLLSRFVIAFLSRSTRLLISWLQSLSANGCLIIKVYWGFLFILMMVNIHILFVSLEESWYFSVDFLGIWNTLMNCYPGKICLPSVASEPPWNPLYLPSFLGSLLCIRTC